MRAANAVLLAVVAPVACGAPFEAGEPTDAGVDQTTTPSAPDATLDSAEPPEVTEDGGADLSWAQWSMPNSPVDVEAGAPNLQSYTDNGDGTVTDNVTGLMWQQIPIDDSGTFPQYVWTADAGVTVAAAYCTNLSLAGHQDWRLPSVVELVSIIDDTVANPSINSAYFPDTPGAVFWSSTPTTGFAGNAWGSSFDYGYTSFGDATGYGQVRCVRH
jgi:hypothetical protein